MVVLKIKNKMMTQPIYFNTQRFLKMSNALTKLNNIVFINS